VKEFQSAEDALDFAISEEEGAAAFYAELAGKVSQSGIKELLLAFADEERGHKQTLLDVKAGNTMLSADEKVRDLKIADYLTDVEPGPEVNYQEALIIAMKKEKAAYAMYIDLSDAAPNEELKSLFIGLAREEANHKLRFEIEYDNEVMRDQ
jgi:rubrerythrin